MFHPKGPSFWELTQQALSSTKRGYDLLAPKFDYTPFRTPDHIIEETVKRCGPVKCSGRALDLGCGTGMGLLALAEVCEQLVGMDFSPGMLAQAHERLKHTSATLIEADIRELEVVAGFEMITFFGAQGHILPREEDDFLRRIYAALEPGGRSAFPTARNPGMRHLAWWFSRGFNLVMRVRNLLIKPEFVMYYLTFLIPSITEKMKRIGFEVSIHLDCFEPPFKPLCIVVGEKPSSK